MVVAIATAVIGGLIFLLTRALLERHKRVVAGRAAARVIEHEFSLASSLIEMSIVKGVWMEDPVEVLSTAEWDAHHDALAEAPGFKGWNAVSDTPAHLRDIRRRAADAGAVRGSKVDTGDLNKEWLMLSVIDAEIATEALRAYAKTKLYKSEKVKELQELLNDLLPAVRESTYVPLTTRQEKSVARTKNKAAKRARRKNRA